MAIQGISCRVSPVKPLNKENDVWFILAFETFCNSCDIPAKLGTNVFNQAFCAAYTNASAFFSKYSKGVGQCVVNMCLTPRVVNKVPFLYIFLRYIIK